MDDIIMFFKYVNEHIYNVDEILITLGNVEVTLNFKSCRFISNSID